MNFCDLRMVSLFLLEVCRRAAQGGIWWNTQHVDKVQFSAKRKKCKGFLGELLVN
jgi:hypothetical protein